MNDPIQLKDEAVKAALIKELHSRPTSIDKAKFWYEKLHLNYIDLQSADSYEGISLDPFKFEIPPNEWLEFNQWILDNFKRLSNSKEKEKRLLDLNSLIDSFESLLQKAENQNDVIQKELKRIDTSFVQKLPTKSGVIGLTNTHTTNTIFKVDAKTYDDFLIYEETPDLAGVYPFVNNVLSKVNAITLVKYRNYLKEKLQSLHAQKGKQPKELTLDQKLLILHYLGALDKVRKADNNTKQALFLALLIGNDAERIRQRFSSINDLFTPPKAKRDKLKEDLAHVMEVFKDLGLQNIVKNIQADLRKLSQ